MSIEYNGCHVKTLETTSSTATTTTYWKSHVFLNFKNSSVTETPNPAYIPSVLCAAIVPLCFVFFGMAVLTLVYKQNKHLQSILTLSLQNMRNRSKERCHSSPRLSSHGRSLPTLIADSISTIDSHSSNSSTAVNIGSINNENHNTNSSYLALSSTTEHPHFNTPVSCALSVDNSFTRSASSENNTAYNGTDALERNCGEFLSSHRPLLSSSSSSGHEPMTSNPVKFQSVTSLEWDNFIPENTPHLEADTPALETQEYWV